MLRDGLFGQRSGIIPVVPQVVFVPFVWFQALVVQEEIRDLLTQGFRQISVVICICVVGMQCVDCDRADNRGVRSPRLMSRWTLYGLFGQVSCRFVQRFYQRRQLHGRVIFQRAQPQSGAFALCASKDRFRLLDQGDDQIVIAFQPRARLVELGGATIVLK